MLFVISNFRESKSFLIPTTYPPFLINSIPNVVAKPPDADNLFISSDLVLPSLHSNTLFN